jgi:hypothetical protein
MILKQLIKRNNVCDVVAVMVFGRGQPKDMAALALGEALVTGELYLETEKLKDVTMEELGR